MSLRIRVSHPALIADLIDSLSRGDCLPARLTNDTCAVLHPFARDDQEARLELGFFLKAWQARHPGVAVEFVG